MNAKLRKWLPFALCCLPGIAAVAIVVIGSVAFGSLLSGPLSLGLIALAMLACPLSMALMMRRTNHNSAAGSSHVMAECCMPDQATVSTKADSSDDRLAELRERRQALEREVAELRSV